jgi:hypothetical protein
MPEGASGRAFLEFFQTDKETGRSKGIVGLGGEEDTGAFSARPKTQERRIGFRGRESQGLASLHYIDGG